MGPLAVVGAASAVGGSVGQAQGLFPPLQWGMSRKAFDQIPNALPGPGELAALLRSGVMPKDEFLQLCKEQGLDGSLAGRLGEVSYSWLSAIEYVLLWRRGKLDEAGLADRLTMLGFKPSEHKAVKDATEYFPPPDDLIRMAVRDVWASDKALLGLGDPAPAKFLEESAKSGLGREWAQLYWDAHWTLPSMTMGFEMFHRNIIKDPAQLAALIKAHDFNPIWHDKLMQLSYSNLTRVDVRRMYDLGVLDDAGVVRAYKDLGYSPDNAELLLRFTKKATGDETKGITVSSILRSYKQGLIDRVQAAEMLKTLDLNTDAIDFQLALADHEQQAAQLADLEKELLARYQLGTIDENGIRARLAQEDAPAGFIDQVVARIARQESAKIKLPTRADLERWYEKDLIDESFYFQGMVKLGYEREVARLFMAEITNDRTNPKRKFLSMTIYLRWLKSGILTDIEYSELAKAQGIDESDIQRAIQESRSGTSNS